MLKIISRVLSVVDQVTCALTALTRGTQRKKQWW
ncbi:hypothetical protein LINPERHAP2_LOCUS38868 [Linum perenne]